MLIPEGLDFGCPWSLLLLCLVSAHCPAHYYDDYEDYDDVNGDHYDDVNDDYCDDDDDDDDDCSTKDDKFKGWQWRRKRDSYIELPRRFINWGLRVDPEQNPVQKSLQSTKIPCNTKYS